MIRPVSIVGAQSNGTHAQHGQCLQGWGPPQCQYYVSVKHNDPAALMVSVDLILRIHNISIGPTLDAGNTRATCLIGVDVIYSILREPLLFA